MAFIVPRFAAQPARLILNSMNSTMLITFNFSIIIAATIGLVRFSKIYRAYQPFIYITLAGFLSELFSEISIRLYHSNAVVSNIFSMTECILWLWQFRRWDGIGNKRWKSELLVAGLACFWLGENLISGITHFDSAFSVVYSFCLVFLAINQVNHLILEEKSNLLGNAKFLICAGVIIFYTYRILVESFYIFKLDKSETFMSNIYYILVFVNLFVNLLYALATLWIPTRQRFTLPS